MSGDRRRRTLPQRSYLTRRRYGGGPEESPRGGYLTTMRVDSSPPPKMEIQKPAQMVFAPPKPVEIAAVKPPKAKDIAVQKMIDDGMLSYSTRVCSAAMGTPIMSGAEYADYASIPGIAHDKKISVKRLTTNDIIVEGFNAGVISPQALDKVIMDKSKQRKVYDTLIKYFWPSAEWQEKQRRHLQSVPCVFSALFKYSESEAINKSLRAIPDPDQWPLDAQTLMTVAFTSPPVETPITLYRGVKDGGFIMKSIESTGGYTNLGFMSTAMLSSPAIGFSITGAEKSPDPLILIITVPPGSHVLFVGDQSEYPRETEILLPHGCVFRVVSPRTPRKYLWKCKEVVIQTVGVALVSQSPIIFKLPQSHEVKKY